MTKIGFKKNKKGPARTSSEKGACPTKSFRRGFALLFSVLISSLLLTIGLSIFNIALKELAISTASRQSIHAFYAADSGREYAKYLDTKIGINGLFDVNNKSLSHIGSKTIPVDAPTGYILVDGTDDEGSNYYVTIRKVWHDDSYSKVDTTITSYGHDTVNGDRVERAIRQDY